MNRTLSFLDRARAALRFGACAMVTLGLALACATELPPEDSVGSGGKGGANAAGAAGKPAKAGSPGMQVAGAPALGEAGEAGEAGAGGVPGAGGMQPSGGGVPGLGGSGGSQGGTAGGTAVCGNNQLEPGEECDDGNTKNWDGCSANCKSTCEQCEKKYCLKASPTIEDYFLNCFTDQGSVSKVTTGANLAQQGPEAGQPKQKLCAKLVDCMRRTNCGEQKPGSVVGCFCGTASTKDCNDPQKAGQGPCAAEIGAAAESMALADITQRAGQSQYAIGMAFNVALRCDTDVCPAECLKGKSISACERCTFGTSTFAQSNGAGDGDYYFCYFQPELKCASSVGVPSATCAASTCAPAADCALATHCAENGVTNCYGPDGHGPCAAQFAAATGSMDPATVLDRLTNGGDYASSVLTGLLETERQDACQATCYPGSAGGGGASGGGPPASGGGGASGSASGGTGG